MTTLRGPLTWQHATYAAWPIVLTSTAAVGYCYGWQAAVMALPAAMLTTTLLAAFVAEPLYWCSHWPAESCKALRGIGCLLFAPLWFELCPRCHNLRRRNQCATPVRRTECG